jgi:hypothetical protein
MEHPGRNSCGVLGQAKNIPFLVALAMPKERKTSFRSNNLVAPMAIIK